MSEEEEEDPIMGARYCQRTVWDIVRDQGEVKIPDMGMTFVHLKSGSFFLKYIDPDGVALRLDAFCPNSASVLKNATPHKYNQLRRVLTATGKQLWWRDDTLDDLYNALSNEKPGNVVVFDIEQVYYRVMLGDYELYV